MKKKLIRYTAILLAFALLIGACTLFDHSIRPRTGSSILTFRPFSGKLFDLDPSELESISVQTAGSLDWHRYVTQEDLEWAAEILNSFRYSYWVPEFRHEREWLAAGGTYQTISICTKDDESVAVHFYRYDSVFTAGTWFYCDTSQLDPLFP